MEKKDRDSTRCAVSVIKDVSGKPVPCGVAGTNFICEFHARLQHEMEARNRCRVKGSIQKYKPKKIQEYTALMRRLILAALAQKLS